MSDTSTPAEIRDVIRDALWVLGQQRPFGGDCLTPQLRSRLQAARSDIRMVYTQMIAACPPEAQRAIKIARNHSPNPVWDHAEQYPDVNRACVMQVVLYALEWAMDQLDRDARPAPNLSLPKQRRPA